MTTTEQPPKRNIRVMVDAGCVSFWWTDQPSTVRPSDTLEAVFTTLSGAKTWAVIMCIPERDQWADAVRQARTATLADVLPS